jgi:hypothetical protein
VSDKLFDIFLSHSKHDGEWVVALKDALESRRVSVWFDEQQLIPGDLWVDGLEHGLRQSRSLGLVVSPSAIASPWVKEEYTRALILSNQVDAARRVRLIPIRLRTATLPGFLEGRRAVDFTDPEHFDVALERLIAGILAGSESTAHSNNGPSRPHAFNSSATGAPGDLPVPQPAAARARCLKACRL